MISNIDNLGNELTQEQIKFFENTKVKNYKDELLVCYHGTTSNFSSFEEPINWFSTDRVYSSQYSLGTSGLMSVYLNCLNMFDCGNTGIPVFDLLPIKPYRFSSAFSKIIERLGISEGQARELIKQVVDERDKGLYIPIGYTKDMYEYKLRAHIVTRTDAFKRLISSKGYDSIRTIEDGAVCFGVFNSNAIKSINNKKPTSSSDINEDLKMDRIKDSGLEDIIGYINKLCYTYDEDGNETPSYCFLHDITDEFGLTDDEALSIAREGGFKEMKVVPNRMVDGTTLIAAKETTPDIVQNDYEKFYDVSVDVLDRSKDDEVEIENEEETEVVEESCFSEELMSEKVDSKKALAYCSIKKQGESLPIRYEENGKNVKVNDCVYDVIKDDYYDVGGYDTSLHYILFLKNSNHNDYFTYSTTTVLPKHRFILKHSGHINESNNTPLSQEQKNILNNCDNIIFYETDDGKCPVKDFLESISNIKLREKTISNIEKLNEENIVARPPLVKYLKDGILELRTKGSDGLTRIFFFFHDRGNIILTNGYVKKQDKMDQREFNLSKKYRDDYLGRLI